jgi:hypothetical protein
LLFAASAFCAPAIDVTANINAAVPRTVRPERLEHNMTFLLWK